jgi:peroxiredoxin
MQTEFSRRVLRPVGFFIAVVLVVVGGVFVGRTLRSHSVGRPALVEGDIPVTLLVAGDPFPVVTLAGEDGRAISTADVLADGGVVLFLDLACEPCVEAAQRWQRHVDEGVLVPDHLFGVTAAPRAAVREFKETHGITFPLLLDSLRVFHKDYNVDRFPLQVVVGASGVMRRVSYDTVSPIDPGTLEGDLVN